MPRGHWSPWTRAVLTAAQGKPCWVVGGLLMFKKIEFLSKQMFFSAKRRVFVTKNESLMKIREKSFKTAKIDRRIAQSRWI
jgi:hypothetical protein